MRIHTCAVKLIKRTYNRRIYMSHVYAHVCICAFGGAHIRTYMTHVYAPIHMCDIDSCEPYAHLHESCICESCICASWLMYMCAVTYLCVTWLLQMCVWLTGVNVTHMNRRIWLIWLVYMCAMTHVYVRVDPPIQVTLIKRWLLHKCTWRLFKCAPW